MRIPGYSTSISGFRNVIFQVFIAYTQCVLVIIALIYSVNNNLIQHYTFNEFRNMQEISCFEIPFTYHIGRRRAPGRCRQNKDICKLDIFGMALLLGTLEFGVRLSVTQWICH